MVHLSYFTADHNENDPSGKWHYVGEYGEVYVAVGRFEEILDLWNEPGEPRSHRGIGSGLKRPDAEGYIPTIWMVRVTEGPDPASRPLAWGEYFEDYEWHYAPAGPALGSGDEVWEVLTAWPTHDSGADGRLRHVSYHASLAGAATVAQKWCDEVRGYHSGMVTFQTDATGHHVVDRRPVWTRVVSQNIDSKYGADSEVYVWLDRDDHGYEFRDFDHKNKVVVRRTTLAYYEVLP